jgi:hypothetical protein
VCLNRFRNQIGRPRPDSGLLRHRNKKSAASELALRSIQPFVKWVPVALSPRVKRPGFQADNLIFLASVPLTRRFYNYKGDGKGM